MSSCYSGMSASILILHYAYRINTKVTYKFDKTVYNYIPLRLEVLIILLSPFIFQNILYHTMITAFR